MMPKYIEIIRALVRPFIAVTLTLVCAYLALVGTIPGTAFLNVFLLVVGFYFGEKAALKGIKNGNQND